MKKQTRRGIQLVIEVSLSDGGKLIVRPWQSFRNSSFRMIEIIQDNYIRKKIILEVSMTYYILSTRFTKYNIMILFKYT